MADYMHHLKNLSVIFLWFILFIVVWLVGLFVLPFAIKKREPISAGLDNKRAQYPNWSLPGWAYAWDNRMDGIGGDIYWRTEHHPKTWNKPRIMYLWAAIRNPAFNWRVMFGGIDGKVDRLVSSGNNDRVDNYIQFQGWQVNEVWLTNGDYRPQYKYAKAYPWKIRGKSWGLFVDIGADVSAVHVGQDEHLTFTVRINPFKGFID